MVDIKNSAIDLVAGFRHSASYINTHRHKVFVIMLDGEAIAHQNFTRIINDIGLLHSLGIRLVIVYGARPQIDTNLQAHHCQPAFHKGIRITDRDTLELVKQSAGQLQLDITARLSMSLSNTPMQNAHIQVVSGNFVLAQPLGVDEGVDYCHSGRTRRIESEAIHNQLMGGAIVLLGPVAVSVTGENFNLSSEEVATQVAIALKAEKIIGFCAQQGIHNQHGQRISELLPDDAEQLINAIEQNSSDHSHSLDYNSTLRFLRSAVTACRSGKVKRCHLISYQADGSLLQELFSREGIGTQIVMESYEKVRSATIDDIGGVLQLIRPLEQQGILVRRSREQLEREIELFTLIERDSSIIACVALYPFTDEKMGEMACLAVHPDYRRSSRGDLLLKQMISQARQLGLQQLFILTTRSIHWFQERGFMPMEIEQLPMKKRALYNYQRSSKIFVLQLTA